jgi:hypothetical protein
MGGCLLYRVPVGAGKKTHPWESYSRPRTVISIIQLTLALVDMYVG